jgi:hypothetical protein
MTMSGQRIVRVFNTSLSATPEKVFPLLCPVREYDWIPTWQCNLIYSKSGYAELGCVFSTDFGDAPGVEIWVVCTYEKNKQIGFAKTGTHSTTRYTISLERNQSGSTIQWEQELTSLDDDGGLLLDKITENVYNEKMKHINKLLDYYLLNGKIKNGHESDHR